MINDYSVFKEDTLNPLDSNAFFTKLRITGIFTVQMFIHVA